MSHNYKFHDSRDVYFICFAVVMRLWLSNAMRCNRAAAREWKLNRGFTGHEHLDAFGIINMNGRVYDPLTAQFFSPDPFIQMPENWFNYNRYAYCLNNPLRYTDLTGKSFSFFD